MRSHGFLVWGLPTALLALGPNTACYEALTIEEACKGSVCADPSTGQQTPPSDDAGEPMNAGGSPSMGGTATMGGSPVPGGEPAMGGLPGMGGEVAAGGTQNMGGEENTGGAQNMGGEENTGGAQNMGGEENTGGMGNMGGAPPPPNPCANQENDVVVGEPERSECMYTDQCDVQGIRTERSQICQDGQVILRDRPVEDAACNRATDGMMCAEGTVCRGEACTCMGTQPLVCEGQCFDGASSIQHCGGCDNGCNIEDSDCVNGVCENVAALDGEGRVIQCFGPTLLELPAPEAADNGAAILEDSWVSNDLTEDIIWAGNDYCQWINYCADLDGADQARLDDCADNENAYQNADELQRSAARAFSECRRTECGNTPRQIDCMNRNCADALNNCGYRSPGRVKWYTLTLPGGADRRLLEVEVRTRCCDAQSSGIPWIFLYYTDDDCSTPMRVNYETQTVNGAQCMQGADPTVLSVRLTGFNLSPGSYVLGVGSGHFDEQESLQEFLVRATITPPEANACATDDECGDGSMGVCVNRQQCGNLSIEPTDQHRQFQCQ